MKIIVEKQDANAIRFQKSKQYPVLKEFNSSNILGFAKVTLEDGIMYAELDLEQNIKGYPAVGYITSGFFKKLAAIGISDTKNLDESIELLDYTIQLDGKPKNISTK